MVCARLGIMPFQLKRVFNALYLVREVGIGLQSALNLCAAVYHGAVVAATYQFAYAAGGHLGIFLCQEHRHLACHHIVAFAAAAVYLGHGNVEVVAHAVNNIVNGEGLFVNLYGTFYHTFSQAQVNLAVVNNAESHERVDHALQVANRAIGILGNIFYHVFWYLQPVAIHLFVKYIHAQLHVGALERSYQSAFKACEQTVHNALQLNGWAVGSQDNAFVVAEQVVENVEEGGLCALLVLPLLYIVNNQHVDGLVEVDKVVYLVLYLGRGVLHLKVRALRYSTRLSGYSWRVRTPIALIRCVLPLPDGP